MDKGEFRILMSETSRADFVQHMYERLDIGDGPRGRQLIAFIMLLNEIVKNIYDHADGQGEVTVVRDGDVLSFTARDFGTKSFDLTEIRARGSTKAGNGMNFGIGVCRGLIEQLAHSVGMTGAGLSLDTSKGFSYSGSFTLRSDERRG